jgi:subtilisin family serine protease
LEDRTLLSASYAPNELLIQFKPGISDQVRSQVRGSVDAILLEPIHTRAMVASGEGVLERVQLTAAADLQQAIQRLNSQPGVRFAEPNWIYRHQAVSNDPYYTNNSLLWGMYSDDSPVAVGPSGTTNQYGSQAEEAWNAGYVGSSSVYVGIVDEGVQYTHPDLDANSWVNPYEIVNGIDDDGNGYIDDVRGWDFYYNDNTTYDGTADDHGTHVAGTIGAEGGNGLGVVGASWNVSLITTKFLGPQGGYLSDAIEAIDYLTDLKTRHGMNIVASNNSWGGGGFSQSLLDAITRGANQGILFIAAAGNSNYNNDSTASYPSNYNTTSGAGYDAVIAVASITSSGAKSSFSNYGATTVDLGAPGSAIYSTVPTDSYSSYSGTSMAAPHVTGAAALYKAANPGATASQIRSAILSSTTPTSSMNNITVTGGRLNISALLGVVAPLSLGINDVSVTEGNSGTTTATFTVTLSASSSQTVTVNFATADGSATAGSDYVAQSGSLTFDPGVTSRTISVTVNGDTLSEPNETFFVNLSGAVNAVIGDSQGVGTILNDDSPSLSVNDVSIVEGNGGFKNLTFTITLSAAATQSVSVSYATANGTAIAPGDYTAKSGTVSISAGSTSVNVTIKVKGDNIAEPDEYFYLNLSNPVNAVISDGQGIGTIIDNDGAAPGSGGGRPNEAVPLSAPPIVADDRLAKLMTYTVTLATEGEIAPGVLDGYALPSVGGSPISVAGNRAIIRKSSAVAILETTGFDAFDVEISSEL